jgi:hypothetical protein
MAEQKKDVATLKCRCGNTMTISRQFIGSHVTCYACGTTIEIRKPGAGADSRSGTAPLAKVPPPLPAPQGTPPQGTVLPALSQRVPGTANTSPIYLVQAPPSPPAAPQVVVVPQYVQPAPGVRMASGVPTAERTIWEGRPALAYHLPGMVWSGLWIIVWIIMAACAGPIFSWLQGKATLVTPEAGNLAASVVKPGYLSVFFIVLLALTALKLARRILAYLNAYYVFTTQRIRLRQGIFSRVFAQMELYRVKDYRVWETLWGRLMNYAHVRIVSSDPLVNDVALFGVPGGVKTVEQIRLAAQQYRAESGVMMIHE